MLVPALIHAGGDGSSGFGRHTLTNWDLVEDFMHDHLTGPRVDPYWYGDQADVRALDERIYHLEVLLGYSGLPLTALREELDLGMTRGEYQLGVLLALKTISDSLEGSPNAPRAYRGFMGNAEVTCLLRWFPDGEVGGLYHHAPARGNLRYYVLRGHNRQHGKLYLLEASGSTQSARFYFEKELTGEEIIWKGMRHASSGRREPALLARFRD